MPILPVEVLSPPFWLSGCAVDELGEGNEKYYEEMCTEFLDIFRQEDNDQLNPGFHTTIMKVALDKATHWFWAALNHPRATYNPFLDHLQPRVAPTQVDGDECIQFQRILGLYWAPHAPTFIKQPLADRQTYLKDLRAQYRHQYC